MLKLYYSFPKILRQECNELVLSDQEYFNRNNKQIPGFVHFTMPWTVYLMKTDEPQNMKGVLAHELAHSLDGGGFIYSHNKDNNTFITEYSENFALEALFGGKGKDRPYSEDFAECVRLFFTNREFLESICPSKEKYLSDLFNI